jgi:hypothetical protein
MANFVKIAGNYINLDLVTYVGRERAGPQQVEVLMVNFVDPTRVKLALLPQYEADLDRVLVPDAERIVDQRNP